MARKQLYLEDTMKRLFISALFLILSVNLFPQSIRILIQDYKQNSDLLKKYTAVKKISLKKDTQMLSEFVNRIVEAERREEERDGRIGALKIVIAQNLKNYAGLPYDKLKHPVSLLLNYLNTINNVSLSGELCLSLAIIIKNNGPDFHKSILVRKIKALTIKFRNDARTGRIDMTREAVFVRQIIRALAIIKTDRAAEALSYMLNMGYSNQITKIIKRELNKFQ
jgi:hypothetical protein